MYTVKYYYKNRPLAEEGLKTLTADVRIDLLPHQDTLGKGHYGEVRELGYSQADTTVIYPYSVIKLGRVHVREREYLELEAHLFFEAHGGSVFYDTTPTEDSEYLNYTLIIKKLPGITLDVYLQNESIDDIEKLKIFIAILQALQNLHAKGIIHGDVKPKNILINKTEFGYEINFIDFGCGCKLGYEAVTTFKSCSYWTSDRVEMTPDKPIPAGIVYHDVFSLAYSLASSFPFFRELPFIQYALNQSLQVDSSTLLNAAIQLLATNISDKISSLEYRLLCNTHTLMILKSRLPQLPDLTKQLWGLSDELIQEVRSRLMLPILTERLRSFNTSSFTSTERVLDHCPFNVYTTLYKRLISQPVLLKFIFTKLLIEHFAEINCIDYLLAFSKTEIKCLIVADPLLHAAAELLASQSIDIDIAIDHAKYHLLNSVRSVINTLYLNINFIFGTENIHVEPSSLRIYLPEISPQQIRILGFLHEEITAVRQIKFKQFMRTYCYDFPNYLTFGLICNEAIYSRLTHNPALAEASFSESSLTLIQANCFKSALLYCSSDTNFIFFATASIEEILALSKIAESESLLSAIETIQQICKKKFYDYLLTFCLHNDHYIYYACADLTESKFALAQNSLIEFNAHFIPEDLLMTIRTLCYNQLRERLTKLCIDSINYIDYATASLEEIYRLFANHQAELGKLTKFISNELIFEIKALCLQKVKVYLSDFCLRDENYIYYATCSFSFVKAKLEAKIGNKPLSDDMINTLRSDCFIKLRTENKTKALITFIELLANRNLVNTARILCITLASIKTQTTLWLTSEGFGPHELEEEGVTSTREESIHSINQSIEQLISLLFPLTTDELPSEKLIFNLYEQFKLLSLISSELSRLELESTLAPFKIYLSAHATPESLRFFRILYAHQITHGSLSALIENLEITYENFPDLKDWLFSVILNAYFLFITPTHDKTAEDLMRFIDQNSIREPTSTPKLTPSPALPAGESRLVADQDSIPQHDIHLIMGRG
ncbi:MAG: hypothetical protein A3E87_07000 [Gammaproteobacteria bacterium RIFCSPHIGHO2_12_FULL_35_23]|nr:MAG: hypothetical protein A3E87_07000 [Gammaproteobacteria bacterium RIFCSPHIGHO2_12_FULL_35_23]